MVTKLPALKDLKTNAVAGLVMAVISVPGALANGVLAGTNPIYGLYSLIAGTTAAALFTSSVIMNVDSTSAIALATSQVLADVAPGDHVSVLVVLAILVGVFQLTFGLLKLGFLTRLISNSVMTGFLTGIALLTILGQVGDLTAFQSEASNKLLRLVDTAMHAAEVDLASFVVGMVTIGTILGVGRLRRLAPYSYPLGLVVSTLLAAIAGLESVTLVGDTTRIPQSLPAPHMPDWSLIPGLLLPAVAIAIIGLVQAAGVSQSVPNPDGRYPDASGDFRGQGVGNVASGVVGGLAVGGSLSGTTLIRSCGGRSRLANVFTGIFAAVAVMFAAPLIELIPMPGLAGLLVVVGIEMFNPGRILIAWRTGLLPRLMMIVTFLATLYLPLQYAILLGVGFHMLLHAIRSAERVRVERIVREPGGGFVEAEPPRVLPSDEVVVLQPVGSLFFAGAVELEEELPEVGRARHTVVILRLRNRDEVGSTFLGVISRYAQRLRANDCRLSLAGVNADVLEQLERTRVIDVIGREQIFLEEPAYGGAVGRALDAGKQWIAEQSADGHGQSN